MGHKKLIRFNAIKTFANVLEHDTSYKGEWQRFFKNSNPLTLELACGKGEYTVGLAQLYPTKNFIGIDIKGNRMYIGAKKCLEQEIQNAAFLRTPIDAIAQYFAPNEVDDIWITFPDPQLRWGKMNKRLTHPKFLRLYQQLLKPKGSIHLKTDSPDLYHFTQKVIAINQLEVVAQIEDVHQQPNLNPELQIKTHYEGLNISGSGKIFYISFKLNGTIATGDEQLKNFYKPIV